MPLNNSKDPFYEPGPPVPEPTETSKSDEPRFFTLEKIVPIVILGFLAYSFWSVDYTDANTWPKSVIEKNFTFCSSKTFHTCNENDWFGIYKSSLPASADLVLDSPIHPLNVFCHPSGNPPDPMLFRSITLESGDTLYLCRMRDPEAVRQSIESI